MSTSQDAPALIQYACERCKTRFVLPPSTRKLGIRGSLRALSTGLSRTFRYHEGLGSSYDTARHALLAKMDDEAYQSFVQSFRFCHECRQFVCNECWSTSRRSCLTCVAKSMTAASKPRPLYAPTGPEIARPVAAAVPARRGRLRRDAALLALGLAIILLVVGGGVLLGAFNPGPTQQPMIQATESASATPTETPTAAPSDTPVVTAVPSDTPIALPSVSPSALATAAPTVRRTPVPTK